MIRRIHEDLFGGSWGVLIVKDASLVSTSVHWTIPDHRLEDGSPAFCLHVNAGWQYNVFRTGSVDNANRVTVEQLVKQRPQRLSVNAFDKQVAAALLKRRQMRISMPDYG